MDATREGLSALRDKYREIRRLRDAQAAGDQDDPRAAMARLAQRFPGALRELDELPLARVRERLQVLEAALAGSAAAPDWCAPQLAYHGWMRLCLAAKRLRADGHAAAETAALLRATQYEAGPFGPRPERINAALVEAMWCPPGGRLNPWVFELAAESTQRSAAEVEAALFPRRKRH